MDIDKIIEKLKKDTNNASDITYREKKVWKKRTEIIYIESLTNSNKISDFIIRSLDKIDKYITKIDISDNTNYTLILGEEQKTVYLGSCTDLNTRILFMKEILNNEKGKKGELFINSNLSEHPAYFREAVN